MLLSELLQGLQVLSSTADPNLDITGVSYDSRQTQPGELFVAVTGYAADGHKFIPMARDKGAAVVVVEQIPTQDIPYVLVPSTRIALAQLGKNWYRDPTKDMTVIGVTGTNGKTTVTTLLKTVLEETAGAKVGLIGTIHNMIGEEILETERTTPESFELQALFAQMRDAGCTHVVMEVSSHALSLYRVYGIHFRVGAFTNLTEDHLDFHGTMEAYRDAKGKLFTMCEVGVLNADDEASLVYEKTGTCPFITTGVRASDVTLRAETVDLESDCVNMTVTADGEKIPVHLGIPGGFTVYNALTVLGICRGLNIDLTEAAAALSTAKGVKGRVEVVPTPGKDYTVLIDYAHTPDALENVLRSVQGFCKGNVIAVFGCGGDRDPIKRPIMGKIGVEMADFSVITSDNPRTEVPEAIIADILKGIPKDRTNYVTIENRRRAIAWAMDHARRDDIIVLCGKGHETYQILGTTKTHLDEREVVAAYLTQQR